jgi:hypothetical protein
MNLVRKTKNDSHIFAQFCLHKLLDFRHELFISKDMHLLGQKIPVSPFRPNNLPHPTLFLFLKEWLD